MQKIIAIVDLGTNTFNVLIAEVSAVRIEKTLFAREFPVKLGEGGIGRGYIAEAAFHRGLSAMQEISKTIGLYNAEMVKAVATSAIRSASNGKEFIQSVKKETGIAITAIDGEREAELICLGVKSAVELHDPALIMDIGGGSVEFILADANTIYWKRSYPVGAARLKDQFHHSDPISAEDITSLNKHLEHHLSEVVKTCRKYRPLKLIGSAGAFETFAEMVRLRFKHASVAGQPSFTFRMDEFHEIADLILQSDNQQRTTMPGLASFRIDMIVMATVLTRHVLERSGVSVMILSYYALKEGVLAEMVQ
ncbi:MAG TPA: exopolyphosphatase [Sphingobacteriaceae bacterium]